jgi:hypothetical protein
LSGACIIDEFFLEKSLKSEALKDTQTLKGRKLKAKELTALPDAMNLVYLMQINYVCCPASKKASIQM